MTISFRKLPIYNKKPMSLRKGIGFCQQFVRSVGSFFKLNYIFGYMKVARNFLSLRKVNGMSCCIIVNVETIRVGLNIDYSFIYSFLCISSQYYMICV